MLERVIAIFLLWGMRFGLAWLVTHEYLAVAGEKLELGRPRARQVINATILQKALSAISDVFRAARGPAAAAFLHACL